MMMGPVALAKLCIFIVVVVEAPVSLWGLRARDTPIQSPTAPGEASALQSIYANAWGNRTGDPCETSWPGLTCDGKTPYQHVTGLNLTGTGGITASAFLPELASMPHLTSISLAGCELTGSIPSNLASLEGLRLLDLSNNSLVGIIPVEFGNLGALQNLSLAQNQLTGPIPDELCHATALQALILGDNGLNQPIPDCLGSLTNLTVISIYSNELNGSIPTTLGQLKALTELELSNNSLSGPIPASLASLSNLTKMHLSLNLLEGVLPSDLHGMEKLRELHLDSNKLTGGIPGSISQLQSLQELRLFDNQLSGGIPEDIGNLTQLRLLFLQANYLSGPLPWSLGKLQKLEKLFIQGNELSGPINGSMLFNLKSLQSFYAQFNRLEGIIPVEVLALSLLQNVSLGFNLMDGTLPTAELTVTAFQLPQLIYVSFCNNSLSGYLTPGLGKLGNLRYLDISNNELSGDIPTEVETLLNGSVQGDLAFNNFGQSPGGNMVPCSSPLSSSWSRSCPFSGNFTEMAINVGGDGFSSNSQPGLIYVKDDIFQYELGSYASNGSANSKGSLPSAPYFMSLQGVVDTAPMLRSTLGSSPNNGMEWQLFQTSRVGADSMMYTVWSLKPGHYQLDLSFIELDPGVDQAGQRVFSVYVQGELKLPSLDVYAAANGFGMPLVLNYSVFTADGRIKVELVGRGSWPSTEPHMKAYRGPTLSGLHIYLPHHSKKSTKAALIGVIAGFAGLIALTLVLWVACLRIWRRRNLKKKRLTALKSWNKVGLQWFRLGELEAATNKFRESNLIGEGGFGKVYRGELSNGGGAVAVKQLSFPNGRSLESLHNELQVISSVRHRNLVSLIGCCLEQDCPIIVCQYMSNGNLHDALFKKSPVFLSWETRFKIALDVASGLHYLHEGSVHKIVHRDVKPSNILLDSALSAKIADFGMARLLGEQENEVVTGVMGTRGYMSPEYALLGQLSEKVDVFSFGVVVMEMVTGRRGLLPSMTTSNPIPLNSWAWQMFTAGMIKEMVDKNLKGAYQLDEVIVMLKVGILCTEYDPNLRPSMAQVLHMLTRKVPIPPIMDRKLLLDEDLLRAFDAVARSGGLLPSSSSNSNQSLALSPPSEAPLMRAREGPPVTSPGIPVGGSPAPNERPGQNPASLRAEMKYESGYSGYSGYSSSAISEILGR